MKMIEKNGFPTFDEWVSESNNLRPRIGDVLKLTGSSFHLTILYPSNFPTSCSSRNKIFRCVNLTF